MASYTVKIQGSAAYIQHRYPLPVEQEEFVKECEEKGLDAKKTSNIEASWYKNENGAYIPVEHLKGAIVGAGKGEKVAGKGNMAWNTILKIGIIITPGEVSFLPVKESYDFVHMAYVKIGAARILRERPAFTSGWKAKFVVDCDSSEIQESDLLRFLKKAGRIGIGDNRPQKSGSFGTFEVVKFEREENGTEEEKPVMRRRK